MRFLLEINSNLGHIFHHFRDTATCRLELSIENCGQTAADGNVVTINSLLKVPAPYPVVPLSTFKTYWLATIY